MLLAAGELARQVVLAPVEPDGREQLTGAPALLFFLSIRRRHTRSDRDWSSDVCSSDLARQCRLDSARRFDEGNGVIVVLLNAGRDSEDVRIEDDVLGRKAGFLRQNAVGARANVHFRSEERRVGKDMSVWMLTDCLTDRS